MAIDANINRHVDIMLAISRMRPDTSHVEDLQISLTVALEQYLVWRRHCDSGECGEGCANLPMTQALENYIELLTIATDMTVDGQTVAKRIIAKIDEQVARHPPVETPQVPMASSSKLTH